MISLNHLFHVRWTNYDAAFPFIVGPVEQRDPGEPPQPPVKLNQPELLNRLCESPPIKRQDKDPDVLSATEVAVMLGTTKRIVNKMARNGDLPCRKVGRDWRFSKNAVQAWLLECGRKPTLAEDALRRVQQKKRTNIPSVEKDNQDFSDRASNLALMGILPHSDQRKVPDRMAGRRRRK